MLWWNSSLWACRHRLRRAYQLKRSDPTDINVSAYRELKVEYQRLLRHEKSSSWERFCSNNLNGDIFSELKKLACESDSRSPPSHLLVSGVTITDPEQILGALSASFFPTQPQSNSSHIATERAVADSIALLSSISALIPLISNCGIRSNLEGLRKTSTPVPDGLSAV